MDLIVFCLRGKAPTAEIEPCPLEPWAHSAGFDRCGLVQYLLNPVDIQARIRAAVFEAIQHFSGLGDLSRFKVEDAKSRITS